MAWCYSTSLLSARYFSLTESIALPRFLVSCTLPLSLSLAFNKQRTLGLWSFIIIVDIDRGWMRDKNLLQDGVILEDHSSMEPQDEFGFTYANPHAQVFIQASQTQTQTQTQKGSAPKKPKLKLKKDFSPKKSQRGGKLTIEEDMPCLVKSKRETLLRKIRFA